jgi:hypothetical protein
MRSKTLEAATDEDSEEPPLHEGGDNEHSSEQPRPNTGRERSRRANFPDKATNRRYHQGRRIDHFKDFHTERLAAVPITPGVEIPACQGAIDPANQNDPTSVTGVVYFG